MSRIESTDDGETNPSYCWLFNPSVSVNQPAQVITDGLGLLTCLGTLGMETRYIETKRGLTVTWAGFGFVFETGFSVLMGDSLFDSLLFGLAMGIGFAIAVALFFKEEE